MFEVEERIEVTTSEKIEQIIIDYRNYVYKLVQGRYLEILPLMMTYKFPLDDKIAIDTIKLEYALRSGKQVVIGENTEGVMCILGYTNTTDSINNPSNFEDIRLLTKDDIDFKIPSIYIQDDYQEITPMDAYKTGNFTVIRNKAFQRTCDFELIKTHARSIAECMASRLSLIYQSKFMTVFQTELEDETANQVISKLYNGAPYAQMSELFDIEDSMVRIDNPNLSNNILTLRHETRENFSDLNRWLGLNTLGVDKESGVSDQESNANKDFSKLNENIYVKSRQSGFNRLNRRYNKEIIVQYDTNVKLSSLQADVEKSIGINNSSKKEGTDNE